MWAQRRSASATGRDQQVGRLHVAVDDAALVGLQQRAGGLDDVLQRLLPAQRPLSLQPIGQGLAAHVLHGEVGRPLELADVVDVHHVGVLQARLGARLQHQAFDQVGAAAQLAPQDLDGHRPLQAEVVGQVDRAHPALAQQRPDLEVIDGRPIRLSWVSAPGGTGGRSGSYAVAASDAAWALQPASRRRLSAPPTPPWNRRFYHRGTLKGFRTSRDGLRAGKPRSAHANQASVFWSPPNRRRSTVVMYSDVCWASRARSVAAVRSRARATRPLATSRNSWFAPSSAKLPGNP